MLAERMHVLDERERQIVYLRFHADMTERQIAREVGISQAHVSRLLAGALAKLRAELAEDETPAQPGDTTPRTVVSPPKDAADEPGRRPAKASGPAKRGPKSTAAYSGRFLVRMPGELHEQLVQAAEREQVSLNRFVTDALAESVARRPPPDAPAAPAAPAPLAPTTVAPAPGGRERNPRRTLRLVLAANLVLVLVAGAIAGVLLVLALQQGL